MIQVPAALAAAHVRFAGERGRTWIAGLPPLAARMLDHWALRPDGPPRHGMVALVLPVRRTDGVRAALKLQPRDEESEGEPLALRHWDGDGAVRLLDDDPTTGSMLLERLDATRGLTAIPDDLAALEVLGGLLARLVTRSAPAGMRRLGDLAERMLGEVTTVLPHVADPAHRALLRTCAAALAEVADEPGDRLLHWDLHYDNVLAALPDTDGEPWSAIDPKPLAGDPGFDLLPALTNRWDDIVARGDVAAAVRRRFDPLVERLALDRSRAVAWTLARILQNAVWDVHSGRNTLAAEHVAIAEALLHRPRPSR